MRASPDDLPGPGRDGAGDGGAAGYGHVPAVGGYEPV